MIEVLLFCIFTYALASIIVEQKIFEEPRNWIKARLDNNHKLCKLISCMFCSGFWAGVFIACIGFNPILLLLLKLTTAVVAFYINLIISWFLSGLLGAFSSYILHLLVSLLVMICGKNGIDT
jgi:hypothetical protein